MHGFGPVVGFDLGMRPHAERFLRGLRMVREATSFGGSIHRRTAGTVGEDEISEGYIRLSVGCESSEDIIEDLFAAIGELR